jgi:hypothetical protein
MSVFDLPELLELLDHFFGGVDGPLLAERGGLNGLS